MPSIGRGSERPASSVRGVERRARPADEMRRHPLSLVSPVDLLAFGASGVQGYRGPRFVERHATVRRGESFARLMRMYDVSRARALAFERAARGAFDLSRIRPKRSLTLFFDRESDELAALEYSVSAREVLVVEQGPDGALEARLARTPASVEIRGVSGTIGASVATDCLEARVPERIVSELTDVFAWEIDLDELRPGDRVRALYEVAVGERGEVVQTGALVAAEIQRGERLLTAIQHIDDDGFAGYFDLEGRSLDRGRLRYPLELARISSGFAASRLHPVLRRSRPHHGVDFAAPTGTPVRAIADGVVESAGWKSGLGWTVRISHAGVLPHDSLYGHLARISHDAAVGSGVRKGQIVGHVGQSGLATGPHLHFALLEGEKYVDPLEVGPPPRCGPRSVLGSAFERSKVVLATALASLDSQGPVRLTRLSSPEAKPGE